MTIKADGSATNQPEDAKTRKAREAREQGANAAGPADVAVQSDRDKEKLLEDGSTEDGAGEVPSDDDRGRGVSVNEARG